MTMPARIAVAAVLGVLLVGGAFFMLGRSGQPSVGAPAPSPTPTASATAAPSSSPATYRPAPDGTWGDWQATSDQAISSLFGPDERIQLSIDWQDGLHTWIQTVDGRWGLRSATLDAPAGEIRLATAIGADSAPCAEGEIGRYRWTRSADGMFLSLSAIEDACADRRDAMSRTWVHSLSAVTDGGLGVIPFEDAWIKATLPDQRFGMSGDVNYVDLSTFEGPDRRLFAIKNPFGIDAPCGATREPTDVLDTPETFVAYVRTLPGYTVATTEAAVAGRSGTHVTVTPTGSGTCLADGSIVAFHSRFPAGTNGEVPLAAGQPHSMWLVADADASYLFIYEGATVTPDDEASVISSLEFLDTLPTP